MSVRSLNKVMLIGNLTRDPELRYTPSGTAVVTFGIATNRSWKDQDGQVQESTQFHNIVAWNKLAEICNQLLAKGMKVYVEGEIITRSWQSEDGQTKYKTEIRVNDMMLLDSKGRSGVGAGGASQAVSATGDDLGAKAKTTLSDDDDVTSDDDSVTSGDDSAASAKDDKEEDEDPLAVEDDLPF